MNARTRNTLFSLALVLALATLAAWPFLARPGLPRETDAELHIFRAAQIGEALRGGAGYVRWAPDLWLGYGYPIFNYYSPLTYYVANLFALLGLDMVTAIKAVFVLGLVGAAVGMYVLVRLNWGERAGIVAAAAYVFSPYVLFIDPHMRGDLAEFFALAFFPWLLWAFQLPSRDEKSNLPPPISGLRPLIGVVLWAALIVTHALMALIFSALLVAWLVWQLVFFKPNPPHSHSSFVIRRSSFLISHFSFLIHHSSFIIPHLFLALGLSALYWLPFLLERSAVHLTVVGPGQFDFHNHFSAWRDLFAASPPLDLGATAPQYIRNLGLAQWLFALLSIPVMLRFRRGSRARRWMFFAVCSAALVLMMLSPSAFIWERVPLMSFIQFPWRLLGPAAAMLAVCTGAAFGTLSAHLKPSTSGAHWAAEGLGAAGLLAILTLALPTMYLPPWSADLWSTTPRSIIQVELDGRWLGTTSTGDFVPSTVKAHPPANARLIASYEAAAYKAGAVDKFDYASLPQGASASVIEHGPTHDRFTVASPQPFVARVLTFDFPGWRAQVDGQPVPITPSDPHGFITFPVPAGTHDVRVEFGSTPPRTVGTLVSAATLLALVALAVGKIARGKKQEARSKRQEAGPGTREVGGGMPWALLVIGAAFVGFKFGLVDRCEMCFRVTSPPGQALVAQFKIDPQATPSDLAHAITLLGFDLPQSQVRAGGVFPLTLYWKATAPVAKNYQAFVHLINPRDRLWGQPLRDKLNPGDYPTTRWPLDKYVWDDYATPDSVVRVQPDAPPGEYEIEVGLYTLANGARAPVFDSTGRPAGDSIVLPVKVRVLPAR